MEDRKNTPTQDRSCYCGKKDESGHWINDACCYTSGRCEASTTNPNDIFSECIHCGGQMFKENGCWWHNSQEDIPIDGRGTIHSGP